MLFLSFAMTKGYIYIYIYNMTYNVTYIKLIINYGKPLLCRVPAHRYGGLESLR